MHEVEDLGNRLKLEGTASPEKSNAMNAQSEDAFATTAEFIALYYRPMDPHRAIRSICTMMVSGGSLGSGWLAGCGRRT